MCHRTLWIVPRNLSEGCLRGLECERVQQCDTSFEILLNRRTRNRKMNGPQSLFSKAMMVGGFVSVGARGNAKDRNEYREHL
jgi:hypothetical protein